MNMNYIIDAKRNRNEQARKELGEAVRPVVDWLYKYGDPYVTVVVNMANTEVYESVFASLDNELRD